MKFLPLLLGPCLVALSSACLICSSASARSLEPLGVQDARLLPENAAEFRFGLSYASGLHNQFQGQDLDRRVAEIPALELNLGLGERVEAQIFYDYLLLREKGEETRGGSGDLLLAFKVRLLREGPTLPAVALRVATKLPNSDDNKDFGTDQTDFFVELLAAKSFDGFAAFANVGLAVLGSPLSGTPSQDDLLKYAAGCQIPLGRKGTALLLSAEGMTFGRDYFFNERGAFRAGISQPLGRFVLDAGGSVGYIAESEDWSLRAGLTMPFSLPGFW